MLINGIFQYVLRSVLWMQNAECNTNEQQTINKNKMNESITFYCESIESYIHTYYMMQTEPNQGRTKSITKTKKKKKNQNFKNKSKIEIVRVNYVKKKCLLRYARHIHNESAMKNLSCTRVSPSRTQLMTLRFIMSLEKFIGISHWTYRIGE